MPYGIRSSRLVIVDRKAPKRSLDEGPTRLLHIPLEAPRKREPRLTVNLRGVDVASTSTVWLNGVLTNVHRGALAVFEAAVWNDNQHINLHLATRNPRL